MDSRDLSHFFRALAFDYDGTLTDGTHPPAWQVLEALEEARGQGRQVVLCTGRILAELKQVFPEVERHFDAIVTENGAVLVIAGGERPMVEPVSPLLEEALLRRGVPVRRGRVLLATKAEHDVTVLEEIRILGLDSQIMRNRGELMVIPAGVSKGWGLIQALAQLGVSHHSTLAVGDAENDQALLEACELGVAVGNAVPSLAAMADVVLPHSDGDGVLDLLRGPLLQGTIQVRPRRWLVTLGTGYDGCPVTVPASWVNVLVAGGPASGKSHLTGLLVEQLVRREYSVCVLDAEGDHTGLDDLPGALAVGGMEPPPDPEHLDRLLRHRFGSLVVDLSLLSLDEKRKYVSAALSRLRRLREETGLPHWIVVEEAGQLLDGVEFPATDRPWGFCLVTYDPSSLPQGVMEAVDVVLALPGGEAWLEARGSGSEDRGAGCPSIASGDVAAAFQIEPGRAVLADGAVCRAFTPDRRTTGHIRHWHKYVEGQLPPARRFYFRDDRGSADRCAANVGDFHREVRFAPKPVLRHHLQAGDFSRWIAEVLADDVLAGRVRTIERWYRTSRDPRTDAARAALLGAVEQRYGVPPWGVAPRAGGGAACHKAVSTLPPT